MSSRLGDPLIPEKEGYKKVTENLVFPIVPNWRMVCVYSLYAKGLPTCMSTVPKYTKGFGKKYKSYEEAIKARPHIEYYK